MTLIFLKNSFPSFVYILKLLCPIKFWISNYLDFPLGTHDFEIKKQNKMHSQKKRDTENFCIKSACYVKIFKNMKPNVT